MGWEEGVSGEGVGEVGGGSRWGGRREWVRWEEGVGGEGGGSGWGGSR